MAIALILYIIFLIFFLVPAIAIVYHLLKFGIKKDITKTMTIIFVIVSFCLLSLSLFFLLRTDWASIFNLLPFDLPF